MCDVIIHTAALTDLAWHFPGIHTTGDGDDHQQNNRNDGVIARDNIMRAVFP